MKKGFYPYPYIWGAVVAALLVLGFVTAAGADEPDGKLTADNTAGVIAIGINEDPRGFLFVSKTGQVVYETLEQCAEHPACVKLIGDMKAAGRIDILRLRAVKGIES